MDTDELVNLIARVLWAWLPVTIRAPLAVVWPLIRRWVIPAVIKLMAIEATSRVSPVTGDSILTTVEGLELIADRAEPSLARALAEVKTRA